MGTERHLRALETWKVEMRKRTFWNWASCLGKISKESYLAIFSFLQRAIKSSCPHRYNSFLSIDELRVLFKCETKFSILTREETYGNRQGELIF